MIRRRNIQQVQDFPNGPGAPIDSRPAPTYIAPMSTQDYPGKGLSLSQLIFALNEELKLTAYSSSYVAKVHPRHKKSYCAYFLRRPTFEHVSRLDLEISATLATIREWRNSFTHINRIPLDILPLIPIHLSSQKDRLRASFVCRHWRKTFLQHAELWSQLFLSKDEIYAKTLLERARGSALDLTVGPEVPDDIMTLLSSRTEQIRHLSFAGNEWADIKRFLEINPGPLPLLHTLEIGPTMEDLRGFFDPPTTPSSHLFGSAVDLKVFRFHCMSDWSPFLHHFFFPNLASFEFSTIGFHPTRGSELLNFLESSPTLRTVRMDMGWGILLDGIPQDKVVTLPNVEEFTLNMDDSATGYRIAAHISCPAASRTLFTHNACVSVAVPKEVFPASAQWDAIAHQYTKNPVEDVTLEMRALPANRCRITFRSTDNTVVNLGFEVITLSGELTPFPVEAYRQIFAQATRVIRDHPRLANTKRLSICHDFLCEGFARVPHVVKEVGRLFKSVGALDVLTIYCCDLRPYLHSFTDIPVGQIGEPVVFPPTKELEIVCPYGLPDGELTTAIVGLAKSQHALGVPFKRVEIRYDRMPEGMEEGLKPWVDSVEYSYVEVFDMDTDTYNE